MNRTDDARQASRLGRGRLFDQDGLPWTSRLHWGLLLFWVAGVLIIFAPIIGIYLGTWLISKGRSTLSLILYLATTLVFIPAFFTPLPAQGTTGDTVLVVSFFVLWLVGAFVSRREVMLYYSDPEGASFALNPVLTAFFGPWYVGGKLRADFPLDGTGKPGAGLLKLIV
jgi:hypothetical protein